VIKSCKNDLKNFRECVAGKGVNMEHVFANWHLMFRNADAKAAVGACFDESECVNPHEIKKCMKEKLCADDALTSCLAAAHGDESDTECRLTESHQEHVMQMHGHGGDSDESGEDSASDDMPRGNIFKRIKMVKKFTYMYNKIKGSCSEDEFASLKSCIQDAVATNGGHSGIDPEDVQAAICECHNPDEVSQECKDAKEAAYEHMLGHHRTEFIARCQCKQDNKEAIEEAWDECTPEGLTMPQKFQHLLTGDCETMDPPIKHMFKICED
jgi:hypothetical protein